jgi:hypothetical protein
MTTRRNLTEQLRTTLRSKAEGFVPERPPLDPTRPAVTADTDNRGDHHERRAAIAETEPFGDRRRWPLRLAAVLVVVAAVGAGLWIEWGPSSAKTPVRIAQPTAAGPPTTTTPGTAGGPPSTVPDGPGAPAPSWVPDGLQLWNLMWGTRPYVDPIAGLGQLFGASGRTDRAVLVTIQGPSPGDGGSGTPVTIRGQHGRVMEAKEFSSTTSTIYWQEDASIAASFHGLTLSQAVAFIDTLQWRSPDHQAGFAPPTGRSLSLLGESQAADGPAVPSGDFLYADQPTSQDVRTGLQLEVRTTAAQGGGTSPSYIAAWFNGQRAADGQVESYDPDFHTLSTAWPDGRTAWVDANGTPVSRSEEEQVAASVKLRTAADLRALRSAVYARTAGAVPLLATASLPSAMVEVRGTGATPAVLCLVVPGAERACSAADQQGGVAVSISVLINGTWYVAAAAPVTPIINTKGVSRFPQQDPALATETGTAGLWSVVLAKPPAGAGNYSIIVGNQGSGVGRPDN